ncbi:MAG TPA: Ig-like domain-containing protein [Gemmatimonadaceae bacterium]
MQRACGLVFLALLVAGCGGGGGPDDPGVTPPAGGPTGPAPTPVLTSIAIAPASLVIDVGAEGTLTATPRDASGNPMTATLAWSSSNPGVAAVASGVVHGVAAGAATITAQSGTVSATAAVTVKAVVPSAAFDSLTYTELVALAYTARDGSTIVTQAHSGQVVVLTTPAAAVPAIWQLVRDAGGAIRAQDPAVGLYVAVVPQPAMPAFIATMQQSALVADAFPNAAIGVRARGAGMAPGGMRAAFAGALVQTIDLNAPLPGCSITHLQGVAAVAGQSGVAVQANDNVVFGGLSAYQAVATHLMQLLRAAHAEQRPVIVNISMGPAADNMANDRQFYAQLAALLTAAARQQPGILDRALVYVAGSDTPIDETASFTTARSRFPDAPVWKSLYFVESSEGNSPLGCGIGRAAAGTPNVLGAPGCNVPLGTTGCVSTGTSFSTPAVVNAAAQAYTASGGVMPLSDVGSAVWAFQSTNGRLPTAGDLGMFSLVLLASGPGSGTLAATPAATRYLAGTDVRVTATPDARSRFDHWAGACTGNGACVVRMDGNRTVTAVFELRTYVLTVGTAGTGSGTVAANPPGGTHVVGTTVTLTATPATGSTFAGWSGACTGTGSCVVVMNSDRAVTATFTASGGGVTTYDGTYSGSYSGTVTAGGYSAGVSGGVAFTVRAGVITVTVPAAGTGTVSAAGSSSFSGGLVSGSCNVTFNGTFVVTAQGGLAASGAWSCSGEATGGGSWTAAGARSP